ncbi:hypothetical protein PVL29_003515 [Vitis rotundifolia]|uniref:HVA22-like protein n=1 Tax=Vitis rotundifolia TaxID=103349 RepID=A0AA39ADB5_VITRO|nr:hypothetical protein PVL29_003515 [Vitis rotundifolia]
MGVMNVLKFSAACFDLLGWPLFALGYPLCSSIWVIETNSISDIRKLVTYWVLFSLISLFDHAFAKLLEWIPFWPYIKLMIICCLVMPHFDGSYYVYKHLVHPCLSMPQVIVNWLFNESKKLSPRRENFLVAADQYIKENGAEALEKLLASKLKSTKPNVEVKEIKEPVALEKKVEQWQCEELNVAQKEIQVVEVTEIKNGNGAKRCEGPNVAKEEIKVTKVAQRTFGATAKWVKRTELNLGESTITCAEEIAERAAGLLNSHLQGEGHKATSEQLKAKNQATKTNGSPPASMENKSDQTKVEQQKRNSNNLKAKNNGISASSTVEKPGEQHKCASSNGLEQKNNKSHQKNLKQSGGGMKEWGSWCNICNVSRTSELDMASHLNGRRHFNRINYNAAV